MSLIQNVKKVGFEDWAASVHRDLPVCETVTEKSIVNNILEASSRKALTIMILIFQHSMSLRRS